MKKPKFTKGPWARNSPKQEWSVSADNGDSSFDSINSQSRDCPIAFVVHDDWRDDEEMNANSHLISVAPEMYKEIQSDIDWLKRIRNCFVLGSTEFRSCSLRIESKEELLAKARGES